MRKSLSIIGICLILLSCENREAAIPAFVTISDFTIETDYSTQFTASSKITTVWVEANNENIGVFELPIRFPLIANGPTNLVITPGINLNGSLSLRNQYEFYQPFETSLNIGPGDDVELKSTNKNSIVTGYKTAPFVPTIRNVEDFEGAGINFKPTLKSDTSLFAITDTNLIFREPGLVEENEKSGYFVLPGVNSIAEFESLQTFSLPGFGSNVYLEVNYRCDIPVTFGVFVNEPGRRIQAPVVTVNPSEEWNKIYINLVTEVSAYPNAVDFNLFFGAVNTTGQEAEVFIDNLKLVY